MQTANVEHIKEERKVPNLRFPGFKGEWMGKQFGGQTKIYDGTHATPDYKETGVPFYSVEHVTANQFNDTKFIAREVWEKENNRVKLERDDILMTRIGDIGTPRIIDWDVEASFYVSLALIKSSEHFNSFFVSQYIQTVEFQSELWKRTIHVAFPRKINLGEIGNCNLNLPSLPEQKKIASFFTVVDQKIQQLTRKKGLLEQYKKGVMQKIFSREIRFKPDNTGFDSAQPAGGSTDENRSKLVERSRNERSRNYPDWEEKRLGEVCVSIKSGKSRQNENGKYPLYGSTEIIGYCNKYSHNGRYVLVARVGANAGTINYVEDCFGVTDNTIIIKNQKNTEIKFIYYALHQYNLSQLIFGSGQPLITGSQLKSLKISLPERTEQQKIAEFLSNIDNKIESIQTQITQTQKFKNGLLQQMFV